VPKAAVLSVKLADVSGWSQGGHCHIMALGVPVLGDGRWQITSDTVNLGFGFKI
jgi:hypothetical protein